MQYTTILSDPPWRYRDKSCQGAAEKHYPTMTLEEIIALPVKELAAPNAHLYLWITNPFLMAGQRIMEAWGFDYIGCITWVKVKKQRALYFQPIEESVQIGVGRYFRGATEHLLFGKRGHAPLLTKNTPTVIFAPRDKHSKKPEVSYQLIERNSKGPYLEMFARRPRDGWHVWGNEVSSDIDLSAGGES